MRTATCLGLMLLICFMANIAWAAQVFDGDELLIQEYLVVPRVGRYGRVPMHVDPVQFKINTEWRPKEGEQLETSDGKSVTWRAANSSDGGLLETASLRGGYAVAEVNSNQRQVVLLEASGHAMVFVNGEPRAGDPYGTSRTILPIVLNKGSNQLFFHLAADHLQAKLVKPKQDVFFDLRDATIPFLVEGEEEPAWLSLLLVNCRENPLNESIVKVQFGEGIELTAKTASVPPLSARKVAIPIAADWQQADAMSETIVARLSLETPPTPHETSLDLKLVKENQPQTRTFRSEIDRGVQSYELLSSLEDSQQSGLLVALHDANETPADLIRQFSAMPDVHVLCPSGRRAVGCDWEDWSARDILEAVDDAVKHVKFDPQRVWLYGAGTGGHGVLKMAGTAADRWAAIVARDPWLDYPADDQADIDTPIEEMLERVSWSNRLTPLIRNTGQNGVLLEYRKDSPPIKELTALFGVFHTDFESRRVDDNGRIEQKAILDFVSKWSKPDFADVVEADCTTFDPGETASSGWLTILAQQEQATLSRAAMRFDNERNLFVGLTANVKALSIDVSHLESDTIVEVALDGEAVGEFATEGKPLVFLRTDEGWQLIPLLPRSFKRPERTGGLRSVFLNKPILVYGTRGTPEENAWSLAKARYDAETILVRLNGSVDVIADTQFNASTERDRNVVIYGNADTNAVWPQLLSESPVQVRRDGVWIDRRPELGDNLACVFVRPRSRSTNAVVGAVTGTGIAGMRATDRLPYFVNGAKFPDLLLYSNESLKIGNDDVRAAGYFGIGWTVEPGEIVWRDAAL